VGSGEVDLFTGGVLGTTPIRKLSFHRRRTVHVRKKDPFFIRRFLIVKGNAFLGYPSGAKPGFANR
jgi:hypothetical protein